MGWFLEFLKEYDYIFTAISTIVSFATLVGVLRFKKKLRSIEEKRQFSTKKSSYIKRLKGFVSSIAYDGIYDEDLLTDIDVMLTDLRVNYSFFSRKTKNAIKETAENIQTKYKTEAAKKDKSNRDSLRTQLQNITACLQKEEEHI